MHLLILGSFGPSLVNFRGPFICELLARGHKVSVGAPGIGAELRARLEAIGVDVHETPLMRNGTGIFADLRYGFVLCRLIGRIRPDIVLTYTIKPNIWGAFAAARAGIPSFAVVTGLGYAFTESGLVTTKRRIIRAVARRLYRAATDLNSGVIFQNPDDRDDFLAVGCLADPGKIGMVNGSGIDLSYFIPSSLPEAPVFLMVSRLLRNKGVREYAEASMLVRKTHPKARFQLVGPFDEGPDGVDPSELKRWENEGLEYLGPLLDVRVALSQARVFVLPSYREGTPRSVLEAMAMGRPIITTDAPGCRETVQEGVNGRLVPVRDSEALAARMREMIDDPDRTARMGAASLTMAREKYDVRDVNKQLMDCIGLLETVN